MRTKTAADNKLKIDPEKIRIRAAKFLDISSIMDIESENFGCDAFHESQFEYAVKSKNAIFRVAEIFQKDERAGEISSYAIGYVRTVRTAAGKQKSGYLYSIAVSKKYHGRSLGTKLLSHIEKELRERDCRNVYLEVKKGNKPAIAMYEKFGYAPLRLIENYYNDGASAIKYVKELK